MEKRIAKKIMKNRELLKYSDRQIKKARQVAEKAKRQPTESSKQ